MPWPALALCVWHASPVMNTRGVRVPALLRQDVVEPVREPVAHLVHAVPGDVADVEGVGVEDLVRLVDDFLDGSAAHGALVVGVHLTEVNVHPEEVAAFARDQQDAAAGTGLDGALDADIWEVGDRQDIHDAPGVVGLVSGEGAANRLAHLAARAVRTDNVFGPDNALLPLVGAGGVEQGHGDGVLPLVRDAQGTELKAIVG